MNPVAPALMDAAWAGLDVLVIQMMLGLSAIGLLIGDMVLPHGNKRLLGWTALVQLSLCFAASFFVNLEGNAFAGAWVGDAMTVMLVRVFLAAGMVAVAGGLHAVARDSERRQGEYYQLLLMSLLGMTLLAGARDLILLLVAFELMSLPLYALAAFARTGPHPHRPGPLPGLFMPSSSRWTRPAEAGLKLFLVGAVSSAVAAYGLSLVYGAAGSTRFSAIAAAEPGALLVLGGAMVIAGVGFKVGAAPFHMWVPDVYQGARTPFVAFLSVAPKAAGLTAMVQLLLGPLAGLRPGWQPLLLLLILASLVVGNLMAVPQQNVKRLLGYSGVAQMGFMLMALLATGPSVAVAGQPSEGLATLLFFLCAYLISNMGIFLVVEAVAANRLSPGVVPDEAEDDDALATFAGLARRSPWLGLCALLFILSLGGVPFAIGFWAKLYVLLAVWKAGFWWLVVLAATLSAAALYYYLQVAKAIYMAEPTDDEPVTVPWPLAISIALCAALVMGVGLYPGPLLSAARAAAAGFFALGG